MSIWPEGVTSAAAFTFDVDGEAAVLASDPGAAARMSVMSHQAYGPEVGIPRLLDLLDRHGVRSTFFVPGFTARLHPGPIRDIVAAGHEVAHHGYLHRENALLPIKEQIRELDEGLLALEEVAGVRPVGYRAPMWDLSWQLPGLLVERGFRYDSSLMDADTPYRLTVPGDGQQGELIEIPLQWTLDDWEQFCYLPDIWGSGIIRTAKDVRELWWEEFEASHALGNCWVLTNHPFLSGRAGRVASLDTLIGDVLATPGVWVASLEEIAARADAAADLPRKNPSPPVPAYPPR